MSRDATMPAGELHEISAAIGELRAETRALAAVGDAHVENAKRIEGKVDKLSTAVADVRKDIDAFRNSGRGLVAGLTLGSAGIGGAVATMLHKVFPLSLILVALALSGCGLTPQGDLVRDAVKTRGAEAYDAGIENAEWFLCHAASVGSIRRRYGRDPSTVAAYNALCAPSVDIIGSK